METPRKTGRELLHEGTEPVEPKRAAPRKVEPAARARILLSAGEMPRIVAEATEALAAQERLYHRYGGLCYTARDQDKRLLAAQYTWASLAMDLAEVADWGRFKKTEDGLVWVRADVPDRVAKTVLEGQRVWLPKARALAGIIDTPLIQLDGEIVDAEGYDPASKFLIDFAGQAWPKVPPRPTEADARRALGTLLDLFCDFPFASEADRSGAVALVLTALARAALKAAPAFLADSATPGAGKGKIIHVAAILMTGAVAGTSAEIPRPEELQKWITSMLVSGARLILIDNLTHKFGSGAFDAVMTAEGDWSDRLLGKTEIVKAPNRALWCLTGRNIQTRGDAYRRALRIRLETDLERPEERTGLKYPDLLGHVLAHRPALVTAALTVLRAYVVAGRPRPLTLGSFQDWSRLVREPLVWLGMADPVETQEALRMQSNGDLPLLAELLGSWHAFLGEVPKTLTDVIEAARPLPGGIGKPNDAAGRLGEAIMEITQMELHDKKLSRVLADKVRNNAGRNVQGLTILREKKAESGFKWRVTTIAARAAAA